MSLKFVLEAGPFTEETTALVATAWGWKQDSGTSAEAFVVAAGKKKFVDILAAPRTASAVAQIQAVAATQASSAKAQVASEVDKLVSFSVQPVTNA